MDEQTKTLTEPRPGLPVMEYSSVAADRNRNATAALVWACLAFIPYVAGILAIVYARRGLADATADPRRGGAGRARLARGLGLASIGLWVVLTIAMVPAVFKARAASRRVQCLSQMRQIGLGVMMYASVNRGFTPPTFDELIAGGHVPALMLTCPAAAGDATKPPGSTGAYGSYHYVYTGNGVKLSKVRSPQLVPLAYEPPTNHADGSVNVVFFDGHAEVVPAANLPALLALAPTPPATQPSQPTTVPTTSQPPGAATGP